MMEGKVLPPYKQKNPVYFCKSSEMQIKCIVLYCKSESCIEHLPRSGCAPKTKLQTGIVQKIIESFFKINY